VHRVALLVGIAQAKLAEYLCGLATGTRLAGQDLDFATSETGLDVRLVSDFSPFLREVQLAGATKEQGRIISLSGSEPIARDRLTECEKERGHPSAGDPALKENEVNRDTAARLAVNRS
jgi:hypothetical protein